MAYNIEHNTGPGPSSSNHESSPRRSPAPSAAIRLRFLVPNPNDSLSLANRLVDVIKDIQASSRRPSSHDREPSYSVSVDQLDDLLLLAQQSVRNAASSDRASIEAQLSELTSRISDVQHAVRGTRPWSRHDHQPSNYAPLVPLSDTTPPPTAYSSSRDRERDRDRHQPVGFVGSDGRIYGLMEDQRRMWGGYPPGPTWSRDYDAPHATAASRSSAATATAHPQSHSAELPPWHPIARRPSRADDAHLPPGDHHHVPRPDSGSSVPSASYASDPARPNTSGGRPHSPVSVHNGTRPSTSTLAAERERPRSSHQNHHHMVGASSSGGSNNTNHTPSSTALTDASSKAPSISFLVNPSYESSASRLVHRDTPSPPPSHPHPPHPMARYDHQSMDVEAHHRPPPMDAYDVMSAYSSPQNGSKLNKTARSDASASGKRRIRNGACTFCREKKLACRPGPLADDPMNTGPPTCDQCFRRQRTCQHDPEHRRRRRTAAAPAIPTKKPSGGSEDAKSSGSGTAQPVGGGSGAAPYDVDADDNQTSRMESEDPSIPLDSSMDDTQPVRPPMAVKDEEVDQLETEWMQPD